RQGDRETGRQGDRETVRQVMIKVFGPKRIETRIRQLAQLMGRSIAVGLPVSLSPCLPVSLSPCHLVSLSPCLLVLPSFAQKPQNPFDVEAREYYGTPESEAAVRKGLEYLALKQAA